MKPATLKRIGWCLVVAALFILIRYLVRDQPRHEDWFVYAVGGRKTLDHRSVYDVLGHFTYNYPPFSALFYGFTLASLPDTWGPQLWYGISVTSWVFIAAFWMRRARPSENAKPWVWLILIAAFGLSLVAELKLSQTHAIPMLAVIAAILLEEKGYEIGAGLLIGFAVQMKITFGLLPLTLLLQRRWRIALTAFASHFLFSGALFALYHGVEFAWSENIAWLRGLGPRSEKALFDQFNMSSQVVWNRVTGLDELRPLVSISVLTLTLWRAWKARGETLMLTAAYALTGVLFCNPLVWPYWWLLSLPLCALTFSKVFSEALAPKNTLEPFTLILTGFVSCFTICAAFTQDTYYISFGYPMFAALMLFLFSVRVRT